MSDLLRFCFMSFEMDCSEGLIPSGLFDAGLNFEEMLRNRERPVFLGCVLSQDSEFNNDGETQYELCSLVDGAQDVAETSEEAARCDDVGVLALEYKLPGDILRL
jgi:hypothetical protein